MSVWGDAHGWGAGGRGVGRVESGKGERESERLRGEEREERGERF